MDYFSIKSVHISCVIISYALFVLRGVWMMRRPMLLQLRWVKVVPHVVDTILLASAIVMMIMIRQYPLAVPWLTAKVIGLVIYIALGMVALKRGKTKSVRITTWIAAQAVFAYIVAVALTRNPLLWR